MGAPQVKSRIPHGRAIPSALANFDSLPDSAHVRLPVVAALRGSSPATVWRHVKAGLLPAPVKLGPKTTAWRVGDLRRSLGGGLNMHASTLQDARTPRAGSSTEAQALGVGLGRTDGLGEFPKRIDTVRATVLARMLKCELMTAMDGVSDASTTRLASHVHVLRRKLGWGVITDEVQVPTTDRRIADVARYSLPVEVVSAAKAAGADIFIQGVVAARRCRSTAGPKLTTQEVQ